LIVSLMSSWSWDVVPFFLFLFCFLVKFHRNRK
jgi:hypothetical protein